MCTLSGAAGTKWVGLLDAAAVEVKHPAFCGPDCEVSVRQDPTTGGWHVGGWHVAEMQSTNIDDGELSVTRGAYHDPGERPEPFGPPMIRVRLRELAYVDSEASAATENAAELTALAEEIQKAAGWLAERHIGETAPVG